MKKYHIYGFEKLEVYKLALSLSIEIRRLVKSFPKKEQFDLTSKPIRFDKLKKTEPFGLL